MAHPFRFALQTYTATSARDWRRKAQRAEDLGYSTLFVADHYLGPGAAMERANHPPQDIAAIPAMMAAADATTTLRVGARVIGIDYHLPVVLAKELMTVDMLSEGRLEVGLGAGWLHPEYDAMALPFDDAPKRIARLEAIVELIRACMSGQPVDAVIDGRRITGFSGLPRPAQQPGPPIMIGGGGRRVLELAGRVADIVSINFNNSGAGPDPLASGPAQVKEKVSWIEAAAGSRFASLELDIGAYFLAVDADQAAAAGRFVPTLGPDIDAVIAHPHALVGSVDQICDMLQRRREEYGISYVTVFDTQMGEFAPIVDRLAGA